ncbi:MAG: IS630 family transposase [Bacteroidetes bacterium]|nr:MAG: IS630 family transposase [Bacteroidota bacterium]
MSKIALKVENYSSEELKALLRKDEKFQQGVRLYACYQVSKGRRPKELEDIYETSFKSICNWVNKLNKGGVEALIDKEKSGRPPKLTLEQRLAIKEVVIGQEPSNYGYNSSTWTGLLLIDFIHKQYGISFKKAQIYNILADLGLSFQKSKGFYPEASGREEKVELLKKTKTRKG